MCKGAVLFSVLDNCIRFNTGAERWHCNRLSHSGNELVMLLTPNHMTLSPLTLTVEQISLIL